MTLQIILVVIGMLLILGIYWFRGRKVATRADSVGIFEDTSRAGAMEMEGIIPGPGAQDELLPPEWSLKKNEKILDHPWKDDDEFTVLSVLAGEQEWFEGADLLREFNGANLTHGAMNIFHYSAPGSGIMFSVANAVKPGILNPDRMIEFTTPGIILFMRLGSEPALSFNTMLQTATHLAKNLGGCVYDDKRKQLSAQSLQQLQDRVNDWARCQRLEQKRAERTR